MASRARGGRRSENHHTARGRMAMRGRAARGGSGSWHTHRDPRAAIRAETASSSTQRLMDRGLSLVHGVTPRARRDMLRQCRGTGSARCDRSVAAGTTCRAYREVGGSWRIVACERRGHPLEEHSRGKALGELVGQAPPPATAERGTVVAQRAIQRARRGIILHAREISPRPRQSVACTSISRILARQVRHGRRVVTREHHYTDSGSGRTLWRRSESAAREAARPTRFVGSR